MKFIPAQAFLVVLVGLVVACTPMPATPPAKPSNFRVDTINTTSLVLAWDLVTDATSYILERGIGTGVKTQIAVPSGTTKTYTDNALTTGTAYSYALKAVNAKGNSEPAIISGTPASPAGDSDGDGISNGDELAGWDVVIARGGTQISTRKVSSDPSLADTDGDGLNDFQERTRFTDPSSDDTDADGLKDAAEVNTWVSNPTDVDSDNDSQGNSGLFDGNELSTYGTSPTLTDSDGDFLSDYQEAIVLGNAFNPLIANVPRFELSFASAPTISLNIVKTSDQSVLSTKTSSLALSTGSSKSSTDTNTERFNAEISATVGIEAKAGLDGGVTASASVTATAGYGVENTKSFTAESSNSTQKTAEDSFQAGSTSGQQISGATMTVGFRVANTSNVAFKLTNLIVSILRRNTEDPTKFILVGNMSTIPSVTLSANETSGNLAATFAFSNADEALEIMRNPANLRFELAGYDILDGNDKSFKFQNDTTNGQTAQIVIDYGNGNVVRQRVATNVERVAGQIVGVKLGKVLSDILKLPFTTVTDTQTNLKVINGVRDQKLGVIVSSKTASDPKSVWAVVGSSGVVMTGLDVDQVLLKSGTEVRLILSRDVDGDGLLESEEYFYGTSDTTPDSDGDGLNDFDEARTGWTVSVIGKSPAKVYPNPKVTDSDGDSLTDSQEKTKGTNPLEDDTDFDGTLDAVDSEPLNPATNPIISNFQTNLLGKTVTVTANVANPSLKDSVISWGDGTANTVLTGDPAKTINTQHTYAASGVYTITLTASDTSTPTAKTATQSVTLDIKDITSNMLAWYKFNGPLSSLGATTISSQGGAVLDSSGNNKNATADGSGCVLTDSGIFNLIDSAFRFNFNAGGAGCGSSQHGSVTAPNLGFSQSFTFSVWIKPQNINDNWIMGQAESSGANPWARLFIGQTSDQTNGGTVVGGISKVSMILPLAGKTILVTDPTSITTNTWYHYAATVSLVAGTTTVKLYRNGLEVASGNRPTTTYTNPNLTNTGLFLVGNGRQGSSSGSGTTLFQGVIDNIRVYGRALTANEVVAVKDAPEN